MFKNSDTNVEISRLIGWTNEYKLTFFFAITALALIAAAAFLANEVVGRRTEDQLVKLAEIDTAREAIHIQSMVRNESTMGNGTIDTEHSMLSTDEPSQMAGSSQMAQMKPLTLASLSAPGGLPDTFPMLVEGFNFVRLDLLDPQDKIVWSTDAESIGLYKSDSTLHRLKGHSHHGTSSLLQKDVELTSPVLGRLKTDVVTTYVPLRDVPSGDIIGSLELYRDVSDDLALQVNDTRAIVRWTTVGTMGGLFIGLLGFITVANVGLNRVRTREKSLIESRLAEREETEAALRESRERLLTVIENTAVFLFALDVDGVFTLAEGKLLGADIDESSGLIGRSMLEVFHGDPTILGNIRATLTGEARSQTLEMDGLTYDARYESLRDLDGEVVGVVGLFQEITERKKLEERLRETSHLASVGELAAGVAHEVNNPLTVVMGFTDLLLAQDLSEPIRSGLVKIRAGGQRAIKVVENLLIFARTHEAKKLYCDVGAIVERAVEIKAYDLNVNNIEVTTHRSSDVPNTMVDEHQLIQVLVNVMTNAEHAIAESQSGSKLVIQTSRSGNKIRISLADDGPGIPFEHLRTIFEPFFTTKEVGKGTGLGLSICYGIVRHHGGDMWAESVQGKGATFHIDLPVTSVGKEVDDPLPQLEPISTSNKHILVVDDEPNIRDLLVQTLSFEGLVSVDQAETGEEAWRKLQVSAYDCILLDLKMPGMGGQQLYHLIEQSSKEMASRIIFLTGDTISRDTHDFLQGTGNPMLSKPISMEDLRRRVLQ